MTISEFAERYNLHDSFIEHAEYDEQRRKVILLKISRREHDPISAAEEKRDVVAFPWNAAACRGRAPCPVFLPLSEILRPPLDSRTLSGKAEDEDGLAPIKDENEDGRRPAPEEAGRVRACLSYSLCFMDAAGLH